jgi:hypothetical protein
MVAAMLFKGFHRIWTGVVRYSLSVSAPEMDRHNVDTILGGF